MSRRDQYGDPEDYEDPPAWLRDPSPVVIIVLVLLGAGLFGLAAALLLRWVRL